jgi:hypothetical protein
MDVFFNRQSDEADFIKGIIKENGKKLARLFNFTFAI